MRRCNIRLTRVSEGENRKEIVVENFPKLKKEWNFQNSETWMKPKEGKLKRNLYKVISYWKCKI